MNRSQRVQQIYRELRRAAPGQIPARELVRCAAELVGLYDMDDDTTRFELRTGGIPFENQALDVAFADGGWRVMYYEEACRSAAVEEEARDLAMHNGMARWIREID
jgi:hypothetical protein